MATHDQVVAKLMRRAGVRKEVQRLEPSAWVRSRHRWLGWKKRWPPASTPSLATLRKYAGACGKRLVLRIA